MSRTRAMSMPSTLGTRSPAVIGSGMEPGWIPLLHPRVEKTEPPTGLPAAGRRKCRPQAWPGYPAGAGARPAGPGARGPGGQGSPNPSGRMSVSFKTPVPGPA
ncbi:hypothetical protein Slala03_65110 [Streptomyces lavendulae subsp. lavendulae]|nr:hypothetical protein Slala03_65110 [Streptomyces lavendulae subsp. lavendulae]